MRCGACLAVFDGRTNLVAPRQAPAPTPTEPLVEPVEAAPAPPAAWEAPAVETALPTATVTPEAPAETQPEPPPVVALGPRGAALAARRKPKQRKPPRERSGASVDYRSLGVSASVTALVLLLAVNVLAVQFDSWSQMPAMRGFYASACGLVGCDLPPLRSLADIGVEDQASGTRLGPPEPLTVTAVLVNRAGFEQRFPTLAVRLLAADGKLLAQERIAPGTYLAQGTSAVMVPNQPTPITLRLNDPGADAISYAITLW